MEKLDSLSFIIKYSITIQEYKEYGVSDIKNVVFSFTGHKDGDVCNHCGYGDTVFIIVRFNDNKYGMFEYWSGCITFDENEEDAFLHIANDFDDLYDYCMTDAIRNSLHQV